MKPKFTLVAAFFLALVAGALAPIPASAREHHRRVHVYFYYSSQPNYYYTPAPAYYESQPGYYYRSEIRYRRHRRDRDDERNHWRHHRRGRDWDRDRD